MNFPALCIDNFYNNPDEVRDFALSLDFKKQPGNYPGERSDYLYEVDQKFFNMFCKKLFSIFYNYNFDYIEWNVNTIFQKIYPYSEDRNSPLNSGWYHQDLHSVAAGVIYLNPNSNLDAGTTIGEINTLSEIDYDDYSYRNKLYAGENIDRLKYQKKILDHNSKFNKTLEFKNVYNRLILYDACYWHKETNFLANDYEPRLTQVFFIEKFEACSGSPIQRVGNHCI